MNETVLMMTDDSVICHHIYTVNTVPSRYSVQHTHTERERETAMQCTVHRQTDRQTAVYCISV